MKTLAFGVPSVLIVTLSSINAVSATTYAQPASAAAEVSGQELAKGSTQAGAAAKQICLPFLGCLKVPVPREIKRPVEGFLQHQIYNALANALGEGIPITSSATRFTPPQTCCLEVHFNPNEGFHRYRVMV